MSKHDQRSRLRTILAGPRCVAMASVFDPVSARFAESLGYEAGLLGGSIMSHVVLGAPDVIVLTLTELVEQVRRCKRVGQVPLVIDGDHGFDQINPASEEASHVLPTRTCEDPMPRISAVDVAAVRVPLDKATSFATRTVHHRDYCLVKVRSRERVEGIGFCYVGSAGGRLAKIAVQELLAGKLVGEESTRVEGLWESMYRETILQGRAGTVMRAISILDTALWDLNARAAGLPLASYLGCWATETVPAYASGGYYVEGKTTAMLGDEMASYVKQGFKAVKMKVGRLSPPEEEKRVAAAREAIGPDVELMLDANNAWADVPTALAYMERFTPYRPYWIEEPFSPDEIDNHAKLAARIDTIVATGEIEAGRWRHQELLQKGAAEILQTDAAVCGGITEWRRIAGMAAGFGVTISPHWFHDLHVHLVASAPNARYVEYFPDDQVLNFRRLIDHQLEVHDGGLRIPATPGLGFQFDERAVARYALDGGWSTIS